MNNFDTDHYKEIISTFLNKGYKFDKFLPNAFDLNYPHIFLRHDVDVDLESALKMAAIDYQCGVKSTFFIMLTNPFYNLFSEKSKQTLNKISNFGHDLALHVDFALHKDPELGFLNEQKIFEQVLDTIPVNNLIFSIHRPGSLTKWDTVVFSGAHNISSLTLYGHEVTYMSDSAGKWNINGHPLESAAFKSQNNIQLILHPIWWTNNGDNAVEKLHNLFHGSNWRDELLREYLPGVFK